MFISNLFTLTSIAGDTPVIADADTGFGSALNIKRTVQMYERAGAAAFHIEDQVMYGHHFSSASAAVTRM